MRVGIHPHFEAPNDEEIIWKFMDFTKFLHLIDSSSLYFHRCDLFKDPFEGTFSRFNKTAWPEVYKNGDEKLFTLLEQSNQYTLKIRSQMFISCWHRNHFESAAMWDLYTKENYGIAIRTTFKSLVTSFVGDIQPNIVGNVQYLNYASDWMPEGNLYYPVFHKRISFAHENELRLLYHEQPSRQFDVNPSKNLGINLKINVNHLIEEIYVSPTSPRWIADLVTSVVKKFEVKANVKHSELYKIS